MAILIQKESGVINIIDDTKAAGNQINSTLSVDSLAKPITREPLNDEVHVFDDKGKLTYEIKLDGTLRYQDDGGASTLWAGDVDDLANKLNNEYFVTSAGGGGGSATSTDTNQVLQIAEAQETNDLLTEKPEGVYWDLSDIDSGVTPIFPFDITSLGFSSAENGGGIESAAVTTTITDMDNLVSVWNANMTAASMTKRSETSFYLKAEAYPLPNPNSINDNIFFNFSFTIFRVYRGATSKFAIIPLNGFKSNNDTNTEKLESVITNTETSYHKRAAMGDIPSDSVINKWGRNQDVDNASPEIVANFGGAFDPNTDIMTVAQTFTVAYNNATDGLGQTGALSILIEYLDENFDIQEVIHVLGNTGSDVTSFTGLGINRLVVLSNGGLGWNANDITFTATTDTTIQGQIPLLSSVTQQTLYHTPIDSKLLLDWMFLNALKITGGGGDPKVIFRFYSWSRITLTRYLVFESVIDTNFTEEMQLTPSQFFPFGGREVVWVEAETNVNNTIVNARYSGVLSSTL